MLIVHTATTYRDVHPVLPPNLDCGRDQHCFPCLYRSTPENSLRRPERLLSEPHQASLPQRTPFTRRTDSLRYFMSSKLSFPPLM